MDHANGNAKLMIQRFLDVLGCKVNKNNLLILHENTPYISLLII